MNMLVLTSVYPQPDDETNDVTATVKYFCEQWAKEGHNVVVVHNNSVFPSLYYSISSSVQKKASSIMGHAFPNANAKKPLRYKENSITVFRFPIWKPLPYAKFPTREIERQKHRIKLQLKSIGFTPEIILSHWVNPQIELMKYLRGVYGAKASIVFHGDCGKKQIRKYKLEDATEWLDAIGCRNSGYAKYVKEVLHLSKEPFLCYSGIPDVIAADEYSQIEKRDYSKKREFIYTGRLVKYKNVDVIIKALHDAFGNDDYMFHIVGDGAEKAELVKLVDELGMNSNVIFHGFLPRENVFLLLKESFCFLMVSDNEVFGMAYLEAMIAGCITVASTGCGVDGIIVNGKNGFLSEQGNRYSLVNILKKIDSLSDLEQNRIRVNAIRTAYSYRDSEVAKRYLDDAVNWR